MVNTILHQCRLSLRALPLHWMLLALLALQYSLMQLALGVQYGDGARNLHWAALVAENPAFLLGSVDHYDLVTGFLPDPPELAPLRQQIGVGEPRSFNRWWGPAPVVATALVWWATHSRLLTQLVTPLCAGLLVLASYRLAHSLFDRRVALMAAALVGLFPLFYEFAVVSYAEAFATLCLTLALAAYLRERTLLAVVFGSLALLCKVNMAPIYCGAVGLGLLYRLVSRLRHDPIGNRQSAIKQSISHPLLALLLPLLPLATWLLINGAGQGLALGNRLSLGLFIQLAPDMLQMLFYIPWYGALLTLATLGVCVWGGLRSPRLPAEARVVLASWLGLAIITLFIYTATQSASNSPRVVLPGLPALALLAAEGWGRLPQHWARRVGIYLIGLFCVVNLAISYFMVETARYQRTFDNIWAELRRQPQGVVLTSHYWPTLWATRQPVSWFESDGQFQQNILHNRTHFAAYLHNNPIRYVVVPRAGTLAAVEYPFIQVHTSNLFSADVLAYLAANARRVELPPYYDLYIVEPGNP